MMMIGSFCLLRAVMDDTALMASLRILGQHVQIVNESISCASRMEERREADPRNEEELVDVPAAPGPEQLILLRREIDASWFRCSVCTAGRSYRLPDGQETLVFLLLCSLANSNNRNP